VVVDFRAHQKVRGEGLRDMSFFLDILSILLFPGFVFVIVLALIYEWIDRKFYAKLQNRMGPTYTGPAGFLQPFADLIKLLAKEDITPIAADRPFFSVTPVVALALMLTGVLIIPIAGSSGLLSFRGDVIVAVALMTLLAIVLFLSGLFSVNRFSIIGAERAVLQLLGYEIPLMLAVLGVALGAGSLTLAEIAGSTKAWYLFGPQVIGFAIYIVAAQAELERVPFDIPEAEQEIVAGWLTEYSGRKLALFRLTRDVELVYISGLAAALFLGGAGPIFEGIHPWMQMLLSTFFFVVKTVVILLILSTIRALFARLRIDQMVDFSWKYLVPISLLQMILVRLVI